MSLEKQRVDATVHGQYTTAEPSKHALLQRNGSAPSSLPATEVDFVSQLAAEDDKINVAQTLFPCARVRNVIGSIEAFENAF